MYLPLILISLGLHAHALVERSTTSSSPLLTRAVNFSIDCLLVPLIIIRTMFVLALTGIAVLLAQHSRLEIIKVGFCELS